MSEYTTQLQALETKRDIASEKMQEVSTVISNAVNSFIAQRISMEGVHASTDMVRQGVIVKVTDLYNLNHHSEYSYPTVIADVKIHESNWKQEIRMPLTKSPIASTGSRGTDYNADVQSRDFALVLFQTQYLLQLHSQEIRDVVLTLADALKVDDLLMELRGITVDINQLEDDQANAERAVKDAEVDAVMDLMVVGSKLSTIKTLDSGKLDVYVFVSDGAIEVGEVTKVTPKMITFTKLGIEIPVKKSYLKSVLYNDINSLEVV